MKEYPVVFITDNNYVIPTGVAIKSLVNCYKKKDKLQIYIISTDVSDDNKSLFKKFEKNNISINIIDYDLGDLSRFNQTGYYVTASCLLKFVIPRLLPQYEKILYIDGDIIVKKDLTDIFDTDVKDYYCAAVADMAAIVACKFHLRLGIPRYFNGGVLLFNAKRFREDNMEEKLFACKAEHPDYMCMDQDVFNKVFNNKVKFLPQKWNCMMPNFEIMHKNLGQTMADVDVFYHTEYGSYKKMEDDAYLLHLTNELKPWKYEDVYMSKLWLKLFKRSPFKKQKLTLKSLKVPDYVSKKRKFIFVKKVYKEHTDLTLIGIPLMRKSKFSNCIKYYFCGLPIVKRIFREWDVNTSVLFIFRFRKSNWKNINQKFYSCINKLSTISYDNNKIIQNENILKQIERINSEGVR